MINSVEQLILKYGDNSNSFLALYSGYHYFYLGDPTKGCIPYVRTKNAWVGLAEPLADPETQIEMMRAFGHEAKLDGKGVVFLPVGKRFKGVAEAEGFHSFQIGSEPYFNLDYYPLPGRDWLDVSHSAKALRAKNYVVNRFQFESCGREVHLELKHILQEWLESRKIGELGFVNRVEPELLSAQKAHFYVKNQDCIWAFVSAIPISPRKGWYFIDVIRRSDSPAGCVEFLMLEAMRQLKADGAKCISLGVSPLARVASTDPFENTTWLARGQDFFFANFQWFYNFKSLFDFKNKFHPSEWQAAYLVHNFGEADYRLMRVLLDCFVPQGALSAFFQMLTKRLNPMFVVHQGKEWVSDYVILRANPRGAKETLIAAPLSLLVLASIAIIFLTTVEPGLKLSQYWITHGAFSFSLLGDVDSFSKLLQIFLIPGFLHWNMSHIFFNSLTLVFFGVTLEMFLGSQTFLFAYFSALLFSNLITGFLLWAFAHLTGLQLFQEALGSLDVGASLGVWSCAGAWSYLLKTRRTAWILFIGAVAVVSSGKGDLLQVNHIVAAGIGYLVALGLFGKIEGPRISQRNIAG
jgi:membrane associated rhomboid family serine protease